MKKLVLSLFAVLLLVGTVASVDAAWYAKFDGVDGESINPAHRNWIEILSIEWGAQKPETGATQRASSISVSEIVITKSMDKTTSLLVQPLCKNEAFEEVMIHLCRNVGNEEHCYMKYELKNVFISSYSVGGSAGDVVPTEQFSLNFEEIKMTFTPFDELGQPGTPVSAMCRA